MPDRPIKNMVTNNKKGLKNLNNTIFVVVSACQLVLVTVNRACKDFRGSAILVGLGRPAASRSPILLLAAERESERRETTGIVIVLASLLTSARPNRMAVGKWTGK